MKWYVWLNDKSNGPYPTEQLTQLVAEGKFPPSVPICQEGSQEWSPFNSIFKKQEDQVSLPVQGEAKLGLLKKPLLISAIAGAACFVIGFGGGWGARGSCKAGAGPDEAASEEAEAISCTSIADCPAGQCCRNGVCAPCGGVDESTRVRSFLNDFVDNTHKYNGQEIGMTLMFSELDTVTSGSLRDYVGGDAKFSFSDPVNNPNIDFDIYISIPSTMEVPKVRHGTYLEVKFICGGSLKSGNNAISIVRSQ